MLRSVGVPEVQYLLYVTSVVCARRVSGRVSGLITDARVGPENCVLYVIMQSYCGMPKGHLVHQNWHESQVRRFVRDGTISSVHVLYHVTESMNHT